MTATSKCIAPVPNLTLVALCVLLMPCPAAAAPADASEATLRARVELHKLAAGGAVEPAVDLFVEQASQAAEEGRLVEYVLDAGPAFVGLLSPDTPPEATRRLVEVYWQEVIPATKGDERLRAVNDCGVLLLQAGWNDRALDMLNDLDPETLRALEDADDASAAQFLLNAGLALERAGDAAAALDRYLRALERDPRSREALQGVQRRAAELPAARATRTWIAATQRLREGRRLDEAGKALETALALAVEPGVDAAARPLLPEMVRYLVAASVGPEMFRERWRPALNRLVEATGDRETRSLAEALVLTYERPEQVAFEAGGPWASTHPNLFSRLLLNLGQNLERQAPHQAASFYETAWNLERENFEAVIYLVNLLAEEPAAVDPQGRLLNEVVFELFQAKNQAYQAGELEDIARLHAILGTLYDRQGRWGSPDEVEGSVFQWRGALRAYEALARERATPGAEALSPSPVLHARLARAYEGAGAARWEEEAFRHYSEAAEGYLERAQAEAADVMVERARQARPTPTAAEAERIEALETRIETVREDEANRQLGPGESADHELRDEIYQRLLADPEVLDTWKSFDVQVEDGQAYIQGLAFKATPPPGRNAERAIEDRVKAVRGVTQVEVQAEPPP